MKKLFIGILATLLLAGCGGQTAKICAVPAGQATSIANARGDSTAYLTWERMTDGSIEVVFSPNTAVETEYYRTDRGKVVKIPACASETAIRLLDWGTR
jgi:hypothetical protein